MPHLAYTNKRIQNTQQLCSSRKKQIFANTTARLLFLSFHRYTLKAQSAKCSQFSYKLVLPVACFELLPTGGTQL